MKNYQGGAQPQSDGRGGRAAGLGNLKKKKDNYGSEGGKEPMVYRKKDLRQKFLINHKDVKAKTNWKRSKGYGGWSVKKNQEKLPSAWLNSKGT